MFVCLFLKLGHVFKIGSKEFQKNQNLSSLMNTGLIVALILVYLMQIARSMTVNFHILGFGLRPSLRVKLCIGTFLRRSVLLYILEDKMLSGALGCALESSCSIIQKDASHLLTNKSNQDVLSSPWALSIV